MRVIQKIQRATATEIVFDQVADQIVGGQFPVGEPLPAERKLAEALGVSRPALREALGRLAQAGLVTIKQGGATTVADWRTTASLDVLPKLLIRADGSIEPNVVRSILEMRQAIGADAARLCAERATSSQQLALNQQMATLATQTELVSRAWAALDFWQLVVQGSDNVAYQLAYNSLASTYKPILEFVAPVLHRELSDDAAHEAVAAAITAGDSDHAFIAAQKVLQMSEPEWQALIGEIND